MKKILLIILLLVVIQPVHAIDLEINSKHAILYNLDEDTVLYEKDSEGKTSIASMTKIMTCLVALDSIKNLNEKITITSEMLKGLKAANASVAGFYVGERLSYLDLLYGLMLPSGADAAQAIAIETSGSTDAFVSKMNAKAKSLGLKHTHFVNPIGLDNPNHYSTVEDVAIILKAALKNDTFRKIFTARQYTTTNGRHTLKMTFTTKNYDSSFIKGGKTGYTDAAGLCLASIANYNGVNYMLVTSQASTKSGIDHLKDAKTIYEYFFNNYSNKEVLVSGDEIVKLKVGEDKYIDYKTTRSMKKYLENECTIKKEYDGVTEINEFNKIGDKLGTYKVSCDDKELYKEDIYLVYEEYKPSYTIYYIIGAVAFIAVVGGIIIYVVLIRGRNKRNVVQYQQGQGI